MRVTNQMLTSSMMNNINRNKQNMSILGDQKATGQKIQRPSQDPVVAVRSLKFRADISELNQFLKKNVPDARAWMDVTEGAYNEINTILTNMTGYMNQGSSDEWETEDRESVVKNLEQYVQHIYQAGNSDYAGRYVFTGYRTDVPLLFKNDQKNIEYQLTEPISTKDIGQISWVTGGAVYDPTKTADDYAKEAPDLDYSYRIRLSYDNLKSVQGITYTNDNAIIDGTVTPPITGQVTTTITENGITTIPPTNPPATGTITSVSANDPDAYNPKPGEVNFIRETGELILSDEKYEEIRNAKDISTVYSKNEFKKDETRPEHYFDCNTYQLNPDGTRDLASEKIYTKPVDQVIEYEINFSQSMQVNNMANESITQTIGRDVAEILKQVKKVQEVEKRLAEVDKMLADDNIKNNQEQIDNLTKLREQVNAEKVLETKIMQEKFSKGITTVQKMQDSISTSVADLGSRYVRLNLTEGRLQSQAVDFAEMQKSNDMVEMEDAIINFESAKIAYNSSLSAASQIIQNTLLDFL